LVLQAIQYQHRYGQATCAETGVLHLHVCTKLVLDGCYKEAPISSRTSSIQDLGVNFSFSLEEKDMNSASSLTFSSLLSEISGYFWQVGVCVGGIPLFVMMCTILGNYLSGAKCYHV